VLLELASIRASALSSSQFRSTFYGQHTGQSRDPDEKPGLAEEGVSPEERRDDLTEGAGQPGIACAVEPPRFLVAELWSIGANLA
jgi:hypothetical protein